MTTKDYIAEAVMYCECCDKMKKCKLYTLQNGKTAWVCEFCRNGEKD